MAAMHDLLKRLSAAAPSSSRAAAERRDGFTRRSMLRGSAMALLLGACGVGDGVGELARPVNGLAERPDALPEAPPSTFPLSIASGDAGAEQISLWTQYRGTTALFAAVWEMLDDTTGELVAWTQVTAGGAGFAQLDVDGLVPDRAHRFAFVEVEGNQAVRRSPLGRFRTALDVDASRVLRFGASACTSNGRSMATIEQAGNRTDLDFFALLGDTTYNDGSSSRDDFRARWTQNLSTEGYRRLRASTSLVATWDDHEISNNWNPETINDGVLAEGAASFFEHLPIRRNAQQRDRVYRSTRWGRTAEVFVLDSRSERRPSTRTSSNAQYLSRAQMNWLKAGLAASPCTFKVILNSVPVTNFPGLFDFVANDRWEGYAAARTEILSFIDDEQLGGVLWVSGDFHLGSAGRVSPSGVGSRAIEVLAGPGAQSANPLLWTLLGNRQFDYVTGTNNYTAFALDPATRRATVTFHNGSGATLATRSYVL
jgi:alkaline phosphatase D